MEAWTVTMLPRRAVDVACHENVIACHRASVIKFVRGKKGQPAAEPQFSLVPDFMASAGVIG